MARWQSLRILLSELVTEGSNQPRRSLELLIIDVRRAHFYAKALRRIFVEMPTEDPRWESCSGVAGLVMSMYGTQDAAANWEHEYTNTLIKGGMAQGKASGRHFHDPETNVKQAVHGSTWR